MTLVLTRAVNLIFLFTSYLLSRIPGRSVHRGFPAAASIEPASICNLACPECPAGMKELTRSRGMMQPALFEKIIGQLSPQLSYLTLYFQGEPYLNKHFFDFISFARSKNIFVATSTNGHFLDEANARKTVASGLNRLIVSVDGPDQESYEAYRKGGDLERVKAGIRLLVKEKQRMHSKKPDIVLQCLVLKTNETRLDEVRELGRELGVDKVEFKTAQFYDYRNGNPLMPENTKYSRYKQQVRSQQSAVGSQSENSTHQLIISSTHHLINSSTHQLINSSAHQLISYIPKNPFRNACFRMWTSCVITWDGKVVPCCYDKDAGHVMGDLNESSFREIWRGERYDQFRQRILTQRKSIEICTNCDQRF